MNFSSVLKLSILHRPHPHPAPTTTTTTLPNFKFNAMLKEIIAEMLFTPSTWSSVHLKEEIALQAENVILQFWRPTTTAIGNFLL